MNVRLRRVGTVDRADSGGGLGGVRGKGCAPRHSSKKKIGSPLTRGAFTYLSTESVFSVESATAFVAVTVSSLAAAVGAVEDMVEKRCFSCGDLEKRSSRVSKSGLYNIGQVTCF